MKMATSLLHKLDIKPEEKIISVRETQNADGNFIVTSLMSQAISSQENICIIILHNTLGHYQNVGMKLGCNLLKHISEKRAIVIDVLKDLAKDFSKTDAPKQYLIEDKFTVVKNVFIELGKAFHDFDKSKAPITVIIDDLSHLLDLGLDEELIMKFISFSTRMAINYKARFLGTCHVSDGRTEAIMKHLEHQCHVCLSVSPLKTGRSLQVSGVLNIQKKKPSNEKPNNEQSFQFKVTDREIRIFDYGKAFI